MLSQALTILVPFVICLVTFFLWRRWRRFQLFERLGIPGPKPSFYNGNLDEYMSKGAVKCHMDWINAYGDLVGFYLGTKPFLLVADLETIKEIEVKNPENFIDRDLFFDGSLSLEKNMDTNLGNLRGAEWKHVRSILTPTFSSTKLKQVAASTNKIVDKFIAKIEKGETQTVNITHLLNGLILNVILEAGIGIQIEAREEDRVHHFIHLCLRCIFDISFENPLIQLLMSFEALQPLFVNLLKMKDKLFYYLGKPSINFIASKVEETVERRKKSSLSYQDMLQGLLESSEDSPKINDNSGIKKKSLNHRQLIGNLILFLSAGQETTTITLVNALRLLSIYPDIQEKVRKELEEVLKDKKEVTYDSIAQMTYLSQVIQETLRYYPPAPGGVLRKALREYTIKDKKIPKEVVVNIPIWYLHRSSKFWTDPDRFDPDRFSEENKSAINTTAYQPFGAGPRMCVGMRLAQVVAKVVLARILHHFKVELADPSIKKEMEFVHTLLIMRPKDDIMGKFTLLHK